MTASIFTPLVQGTTKMQFCATSSSRFAIPLCGAWVLALKDIVILSHTYSSSRWIGNTDIEKPARSEELIVITRIYEKEFNETYEFDQFSTFAKHS